MSVGWDMVGNITAASFKSLIAVLVYAILPEMWYWFNIFLGRGTSNGFHNSSHSTGQGTNLVFLPVIKYVYPNYAFWNLENNHRVGLSTFWTYCDMNVS
jgi:hypothetical protein